MLITLISLTTLTYLLSVWQSNTTFDKLFQSAAVTTFVYILFTLIFGELVSGVIKHAKVRYRFRKLMWLTALLLAITAWLHIWIYDPQALLIAYGVITAGVAFALQDVIKNFVGSFIIFFGGLYRVGHRIEVANVCGDVIDIGLFYTTLMEVGGWVGANQPSGRLTSIPNGTVLHSPIYNFSRQHKFLWDELVVTVSQDSDWGEAMRILGDIGLEHTKDFIDKANKNFSKLERHYYVEGSFVEPKVYIKPGKRGYELALRYVVHIRKRRSTTSDIWGHTLRVFGEHPNIHIVK